MKKRQIIIVAGIALVVAAVFVSQWLAGRSQSRSPQSQSSQASATVVSTREVDVQDIQSYVDVTGRLEAEDKIDIYEEVGGVLLPTNPKFKVGNRFERGYLLVNIDDSDARQNLRAQKSSFVTTLASVVPNLKIDFPEAYETLKPLNLTTNVRKPPCNWARLTLRLFGMLS
jgi:multidrug efflux pump subunit AcrA (membrane-fusion protein)